MQKYKETQLTTVGQNVRSGGGGGGGGGRWEWRNAALLIMSAALIHCQYLSGFPFYLMNSRKKSTA